MTVMCLWMVTSETEISGQRNGQRCRKYMDGPGVQASCLCNIVTTMLYSDNSNW
jgi:hypothetical protein